MAPEPNQAILGVLEAAVISEIAQQNGAAFTKASSEARSDYYVQEDSLADRRFARRDQSD